MNRDDLIRLACMPACVTCTCTRARMTGISRLSRPPRPVAGIMRYGAKLETYAIPELIRSL